MRNAVIGALAALSLVACSSAAHSAGPKTAVAVAVSPTTAPAHAERVASFSGTGTQTTVPFVIAPSALSWQTTWSVAGHTDVITLRSAGGQAIAQLVNHVGKTLGHAQRQGPGPYSLTIETDGAWSVFIDQTLPGPA